MNNTSAPERPWLRRYPEGVDWHAPIDTHPMPALLDRAAERFGDRACSEFMGALISYRDMADRADRFAKGLQALGVKKGSRVGLFLPNCPYYPIAYFGAMKAGATVVNFNPLYVEREVASQVGDSGTDIMVTLDLVPLYDKLKGLLASGDLKRLVLCSMTDILPGIKRTMFGLLRRGQIARCPDDERHVRYARLIDNDGQPEPVAIDVEDTAVLQYTGGTTGTPKGARLTHGNLSANVEQARRWFTIAKEGRERTLAVLPFFHVFAMTVVLNLSIRIGATIIMMPRFELDTMMKTIAKRRPSYMAAVPTIFTAVNNHRNLKRFDLTSLTMGISGGAPLPVEVKERFETLTGCRLVEGYGLTEASPVTHANPLEGLNKTGTIGLPLPGTEAKLVGLEDPDTEVPIGERGELCIRGPQVMPGYLDREEETALALREGWLHTGDVGVMDEDGYLSIVDRIKDLIIAGGFNIYPRTVEEAIYEHEAVEECVVAGVPDKYRGETVKAFVKLREDHTLDEAELRRFLGSRLSPIELPKLIEIRPGALPKTMIGKLDRKALVAEHLAMVGKAKSEPRGAAGAS